MSQYPQFGFGAGLRAPHYELFLSERPKAVEWLEILSDNYLHAHPGYLEMLAELRQDYPMAMHGVSLSIGSTDPLNEEYVRALRRLAQHVQAGWVSDHLCYTGVGGEQTHDLLPIPYTEEALAHVIPRIHKAQDILGQKLVFENASSYMEFSGNTLSEPEFLRALHEATGCGILLDVNNVFVSCFNHGWNAKAYIDAIPAQAVAQYHLSGHTDMGTHRIDTHDAPVIDEVWQLFSYTLSRIGPRSTLLEWDAQIPPFETLAAEVGKARQLAARAEAA
ncbi:MAG: DUF692 domain-containing protein [Proteobacteria bacterium]|nr:DUF692 domain-containing protein [Pseudomonadota bacterium]